MSPSSSKTPSSHQSSPYQKKPTRVQSLLLLVRKSLRGMLGKKASTSLLTNIPEALLRVSTPSPIQELLSQADQTWADLPKTPLGPILPLFQLESLSQFPFQTTAKMTTKPSSTIHTPPHSLSMRPTVPTPTSNSPCPLMPINEKLSAPTFKHRLQSLALVNLKMQQQLEQLLHGEGLTRSESPTSMRGWSPTRRTRSPSPLLTLSPHPLSSVRPWAQPSSCTLKIVTSHLSDDKKPSSDSASSVYTTGSNMTSGTISRSSSMTPATRLAASWKSKSDEAYHRRRYWNAIWIVPAERARAFEDATRISYQENWSQWPRYYHR
ncbi:hypothetical protein ARMSODRAFT_1011585 [Armillaria solidipes]|uniref:Uncharacterized protein n=1 Tax=Armillaria solidipes TaxID=1076256 RepID=A0A2H3CD88_9AGAR|nr:hypothetical protein ARMSODRAFT_1011585 [Armillaria solidipes]